jgi:hypothetical protein
MSTNENNLLEGQTPKVSPGTYSPVTVTVKDTMGAFFLGILSVILLIGWIRTETHNRELITQLEKTNGNLSVDAR